MIFAVVQTDEIILVAKLGHKVLPEGARGETRNGQFFSDFPLVFIVKVNTASCAVDVAEELG